MKAKGDNMPAHHICFASTRKAHLWGYEVRMERHLRACMMHDRRRVGLQGSEAGDQRGAPG